MQWIELTDYNGPLKLDTELRQINTLDFVVEYGKDIMQKVHAWIQGPSGHWGSERTVNAGGVGKEVWSITDYDIALEGRSGEERGCGAWTTSE